MITIVIWYELLIVYFVEIVVFDLDYEGISSNINGFQRILFLLLNDLFELNFELFGQTPIFFLTHL